MDMKESIRVKIHKPSMSYGLIPYNRSGKNIHYLLIQRRDTMEYIEFIRGKYKHSLLPTYFSLMTREERSRIMNHNFDALWADLWINKTSRSYREQYIKAKERYVADVHTHIENNDKCQEHAPWGFPKGRKMYGENIVDTALREYEEETCLENKSLRLMKNKIISETFRGSDEKMYCFNFFLAESPEQNLPQRVDTPECIRQSTISEEVADAKWVTYEEGMKMLDEPFKEILKRANDLLTSD